ncbi:serine threonine- phosphatase BSL3 [Olea europaea subsp. europaea]|uniref:Serine/threonine-protein phosphatase n=1 Tax=Olea europaea subsp. europaea TaxID=158383 RepID=A0A8S0QTQ9_OLEEU|nr:serine threonine- phosphatase BSL3 [Olea europaea subsp. europaea]
MDVDSTMTTEPELDNDSSAQKTAGEDSEQPTTVPESPSTNQQPPLQQQQHSSNNSSSISNIDSGVGAAVLAGPRCAPTYSVVNATMDKEEDGPGPRCGHTLTAVQAVGEEGTPGYMGPRLILFGGATALEGNSAASGAPTSAGSAGILDQNDVSANQLYATASARSDGLLLLCGGRDAISVPLASAYGLAKHRDGRWEWAIAPGVSPSPRYQHAAVFVNARLHVSGGALGGGRMVEDSSSVAVLDTAAGVWCDTQSVVTSPRTGRFSADAAGGDASVELTRRCRHAAAAVGDLIFVYGGLRGGVLLDDLLVAEDLAAAETTSAASHAAAAAATNVLQGRLPGRYGFIVDGTNPPVPGAAAADGDVIVGTPVAPPVNGDMFTDISTENAMLQGSRQNKGVEYLVEAAAAEAEAITATLAAAKARQVNGEIEFPDRGREAEATSSGKQITTLIKPDSAVSNNSTSAGVRLHHRAVVVAAETGGVLGVARQLSIDQFENEGRRVSYGTQENATAARKLLDRQMSVNSVPKKVIAHLLKPRGWKPPVRRQFFLDCNEIADLCDSAERIFAAEPSVLQLKAPIKIFGDLHGQFGDLMRLFDEYGSPSTAGDIAYIDYLFLGDYVDRGQHSLETITLLLALKVEHLHQVHLIRGNHEAADINALFGFRIECIERMGERDGIWTWHRINRLFNWLPLAALIEKKIICMHGGIGRSINHVEQIENIQRPITMEAGSIVLMDLLWSDPTENDSVEGLRPNARGPGLVTFGPDRVMEFCNNNDLQLIVRAHECVMDGFERFAQGHLITIFSATNYCGTANNAGAILVLGRDLVVVPKLIHPLPPAISSSETSPERQIEDTWMQELNANRPPTPTRGRPQVTNDRGSLAWI